MADGLLSLFIQPESGSRRGTLRAGCDWGGEIGSCARSPRAKVKHPFIRRRPSWRRRLTTLINLHARLYRLLARRRYRQRCLRMRVFSRAKGSSIKLAWPIRAAAPGVRKRKLRRDPLTANDCAKRDDGPQIGHSFDRAVQSKLVNNGPINCGRAINLHICGERAQHGAAWTRAARPPSPERCPGPLCGQ